MSSTSSRGSRRLNLSNIETKYCKCPIRKPVAIRTSWTNDNPGRRFINCIDSLEGGCKYFEWLDEPICQRSKQILPGLLKRLEVLEDESVGREALIRNVKLLQEENVALMSMLKIKEVEITRMETHLSRLTIFCKIVVCIVVLLSIFIWM